MITQLRKTHVFLLLVVLGLSINGIDHLSAQEGQLVDVAVHSPSLEGNLLEDSAGRNVTIYLPPEYEENPEQRYPVIYLLHGFFATNKIWIGREYLNINIKSIADDLINQEKIIPMIIVMPDARNKYQGSFYANSPVTGSWEDFITQELVEYTDRTYRTLSQVVSRGIAGHSMGGDGAMKLALKHPDTYSAVYSMSGALAFEEFFATSDVQGWISSDYIAHRQAIVYV